MIIGLTLVGAVTFAGCVSDEAGRYYLAEKYPARAEADVEVLRAPPIRPHVIMADLQARGASIRHMRQKAAEIGGDAVIIRTLGGYASQSQTWASEDEYATSYSRITATVVKYK
ncbi:MAG TPA: hypothetical protein VG797_11840 [Phycisphaerales bacterium]|nr:hypothetical protein [Phycisphaerales bacterium]